MLDEEWWAIGSVYVAYVHAMFSGKQRKRRVQLVGVSGTSRSTERCLREFNLSVSDEENDGAAAFVTQRRNGASSGWQIHF